MAELYPVDIVNNNTGHAKTYYFPEVDEPSDTPQNIALRRHILDLVAVRIAQAEREERNGRRASTTEEADN